MRESESFLAFSTRGRTLMSLYNFDAPSPMSKWDLAEAVLLGLLAELKVLVDNFGKLYRSCGNCKTQTERHVIFSDISATEGKLLAGINSNYGDTATFKSIKTSGVKDICEDFKGTDNNSEEPTKVGSGPSDACIYSESDISE